MSNQDTEVERLKQEVKRLNDENADLNRRLERQQIHASILGIDTIKKYDEALERLQKERDSLQETIDLFVVWSRAQAFSENENYRIESERFPDILKKALAPQIATHIHNIATDIVNSLYSEYDEYAQPEDNPFRETPFEEAVKNFMVAAILHLAYRITSDANVSAASLEMLCEMIEAELNVRGTANLKLLYAIKETIGYKPATAKKYLETHQTWVASGKTQEELTDKEGEKKVYELGGKLRQVIREHTGADNKD